MKAKKINKIYLIVMSVTLLFLCSSSIALLTFHNAEATDGQKQNTTETETENNETYQKVKWILHGHDIYDRWSDKNVYDGDIVEYSYYGKAMGFTNFRLIDKYLNCDIYSGTGETKFTRFYAFSTFGGDYIVGMRVNGVDARNYVLPEAIFLQLSEDPDFYNTIELLFSTTKPPEVNAEVPCVFNANGGYFSSNASETVDKIEKYANRYEFPKAPSKDGLNLKGWYDAQNNQITTNNSFFFTENTTFTAKWFGTLSYDLNTGEGPEIPAVDYDEGTSVTLHSGEGITKTDDVLLGWNTAPDRSGQHYDFGETITFTKNTKLYAEWKYYTPEPEPEPTPVEEINAVPQTGDTLGFAVAGLSVLALASAIVLINSRRRRGLNL